MAGNENIQQEVTEQTEVKPKGTAFLSVTSASSCSNSASGPPHPKGLRLRMPEVIALFNWRVLRCVFAFVRGFVEPVPFFDLREVF